MNSQILSNDKPAKLTMGEIALRGGVIAAIITVPSLLSFLLTWVVLDDLIYAALVGAIVHFIAMGFSLKISKKILLKK